MPLSPAEKQKAYRERKAREELLRGLLLSPEGCENREQYIRWHKAAATLEAERRGSDEEATAARVARAERYAQWRWQGWLDGEVAAL